VAKPAHLHSSRTPGPLGAASACPGRHREGCVPYLGRQPDTAANLPGAGFPRPRPSGEFAETGRMRPKVRTRRVESDGEAAVYWDGGAGDGAAAGAEEEGDGCRYLGGVEEALQGLAGGEVAG
jgi:hypothetical protein